MFGINREYATIRPAQEKAGALWSSYWLPCPSESLGCKTERRFAHWIDHRPPPSIFSRRAGRERPLPPNRSQRAIGHQSAFALEPTPTPVVVEDDDGPRLSTVKPKRRDADHADQQANISQLNPLPSRLTLAQL